MSLTFHYAPFSSASTVHAALEELGVPYEKVRVDLQKSEQKRPAFLALNPNGKVPLLVHDGAPIFESAAIVIHLGETFGEKARLYPAPGADRALATQWLVWTNVSLAEALSRHQYNTAERIPAEQKNAKAAEVAKADVLAHLAILEKALTGKKFLVGDAFSLVDTHVAGWAHYIGMCGFDTKAFPATHAWMTTTMARPAYTKVMRPDA
jgi:glutathione S-transferase